MARILVVDDEMDLCEILRFNLESEGFEVDTANSAEEALKILCPEHKLILLDVMMEAMSGYEMALKLRTDGNNIPIIFLTALNAETDQLKGFNVGADDYVTKPFSFQTVLARVKAVLKRTSPETTSTSPNATIQVDDLTLNLDDKTITIGSEAVILTKKEFLILQLLLQHRGHYYTREQIMDEVWDADTYVGDRSVDVHIARLRKKLGEIGNKIGNKTGFGYYFEKS